MDEGHGILHAEAIDEAADDLKDRNCSSLEAERAMGNSASVLRRASSIFRDDGHRRRCWRTVECEWRVAGDAV